MIDEYWTWQFYGYHSDELKPFSHKPIVARCDDCCQYRLLSNATYSDICVPCANSSERVTPEHHRNLSESRMGEKNPMYGRTGKNAPAYGRTGALHPYWKGGRPMVTCFICGTAFETSRQQGEESNHHLCSSECKRVFSSMVHTERFKDPAQREHLSVRMAEFYSVQVNREKHSAIMQGIPYDEWERFATNQGYCPAFDETCRESNREKYDRRCFLCGLDESRNISSTGKHKKLSVHHVDMDKQQGCDGHKWKLVPLCMHHHGKAHADLWTHRIIYLLNNVWNKEL